MGVKPNGKSALLFCAAASLVFSTVALSGDPTSKHRNVIVLVMDGCGASHTSLTRWYKGTSLHLDRMNVAGVRTYGSESIITDSAPAATAFACGYKTSDGFVAVLPARTTIPGVPAVPASLRYKPIPSVLEGARLYGKSVGLVTTINIQHATPAGYSAHTPDRSKYADIAEQQVFLDIDVVLGGGRRYLLPKARGGSRNDGDDLTEALAARGYQLVSKRSELLGASPSKLWGMFAADAMSHEFDRIAFELEQPSLAEMTEKAIEILSRDPDGFFLMVEGGRIDTASHAHDPIGVISDVLAYDEAVGKAFDFAQEDGETVVLAFSDHGNGGLSIGSKTTTVDYTRLATVVNPLRAAKLTGEGVSRALGTNRSSTRIRSVMSEYYGVSDLSSSEVQTIVSTDGSVARVIGPMMSQRSNLAWTTGNHTGEDLFLYYWGFDQPLGAIENTEIARMCAETMGFDLAEVDRELFVEAKPAFEAIGAQVSLDQTDSPNPVFVVQTPRMTARMPINRDTVQVVVKVARDLYAEQEFMLDGVTIYAPNTGKVYVPAAAIDLIKEPPLRDFRPPTDRRRRESR